jgi:hypothetical protein
MECSINVYTHPRRILLCHASVTTRRYVPRRQNPFTGEVVRFYDSTANPDECNALEAVLLRYDINFDDDSITYRGKVGATEIFIPNVNIGNGHFRGASIELVGEVISEESITAVLEMGKSANLFFENSIGEGALAAPTSEVRDRVATVRDEEVLLVDTVPKLRAWLMDHVRSRKVI